MCVGNMLGGVCGSSASSTCAFIRAQPHTGCIQCASMLSHARQIRDQIMMADQMNADLRVQVILPPPDPETRGGGSQKRCSWSATLTDSESSSDTKLPLRSILWRMNAPPWHSTRGCQPRKWPSPLMDGAVTHTAPPLANSQFRGDGTTKLPVCWLADEARVAWMRGRAEGRRERRCEVQRVSACG